MTPTRIKVRPLPTIAISEMATTTTLNAGPSTDSDPILRKCPISSRVKYWCFLLTRRARRRNSTACSG